MKRETKLSNTGAFFLPRLLIGLCAALSLSGCVVVGGSSRGGFFIWPGSLGLLLILLLVFLLLRRR